MLLGKDRVGFRQRMQATLTLSPGHRGRDLPQPSRNVTRSQYTQAPRSEPLKQEKGTGRETL